MSLSPENNFVSVGFTTPPSPARFSISNVALFVDEGDVSFAEGVKFFSSFPSAKEEITENSDTFIACKSIFQDNGYNISRHRGGVFIIKVDGDAVDLGLEIASKIGEEEVKNSDFSLFTTTLALTFADTKTIRDALDPINHLFIATISDADKELYDSEIANGDFKSVKNVSYTLAGTEDEKELLKARCGILTQCAGNDVKIEAKRSIHRQPLGNVMLTKDDMPTQADKDTATSKGVNVYTKYTYGIGDVMFLTDKGYDVNDLTNIVNLKKSIIAFLTNEFTRTVNKNNDDLDLVKTRLENGIFDVFAENNVFSKDIKESELANITFGDYEAKKQSLIELRKGYFIDIPSAETIEGKEVPINVAIAISETVLSFNVGVNIIN